MNVLIAGSSGLVGSALLQLLSSGAEIELIYALVRRIPDRQLPKVQYILTDFEQLEAALKRIPEPIQIIFSCMGTTKAQTPDPLAYQVIEVQYPLQIATWGLKQGVQQFHYISALGANAQSRNHYQRLKGQAEEALDQLSIPGVYLYRPGLLLGARPKQRTGERIAAVVLRLLHPVLTGKWARYRAIPSTALAGFMYQQCLLKLPATHRTFPNEQILSGSH